MPDPAPSISGLSGAEAQTRLREEGPNELPTGRRRGFLAAAAGVVREPMFLLLVACGVLYMLTVWIAGDRR